MILGILAVQMNREQSNSCSYDIVFGRVMIIGGLVKVMVGGGGEGVEL